MKYSFWQFWLQTLFVYVCNVLELFCSRFSCSVAMPTKLFVGNLPAGASNEDIQGLFEQYGTITECAVLGSFGFVVSSLY